MAYFDTFTVYIIMQCQVPNIYIRIIIYYIFYNTKNNQKPLQEKLLVKFELETSTKINSHSFDN